MFYDVPRTRHGRSMSNSRQRWGNSGLEMLTGSIWRCPTKEPGGVFEDLPEVVGKSGFPDSEEVSVA